MIGVVLVSLLAALRAVAALAWHRLVCAFSRLLSLAPIVAVVSVALVAPLAGCGAGSGIPAPPTAVTATPANTSAQIAFLPPLRSGQSAISTYTVTCTAPDDAVSASGSSSPIAVFGLRNGLAYSCSVRASNSAGTSVASAAVSVTPEPPEADSLAAVYKSAKWAQGMSVTFPSPCRMTVWPLSQPNHAVDAYYLAPPSTPRTPRTPPAPRTPAVATAPDQQAKAVPSINQVVASTALSAMKLALWPYTQAAPQAPMDINICPVKAPTNTTVNTGAIGILISGAALYQAGEISGHRATVAADDVAYRFKDAAGQNQVAHFLDACNGHPAPQSIGGAYHYHGFSSCVTRQVDRAGSPSHLIGVALDGFPIYGDKDIQGKTVPLDQLDPCNGIHSPTPEFPQGIYHYVLPAGEKTARASLRCYAGAVSKQDMQTAQDNGFCYSADQAGSAGPMPSPMAMGRSASAPAPR